MRFGAVFVLLATLSMSCGGGGLFRQYEYEEEMYLSLDGSATLYVNTSVAALNALRGTTFDAGANARIDRDAVRQYFTTPVSRVTRRPSLSRRSGRQFVHLRLEVDDVRRLGEAAPFAWSTYRFEPRDNLLVYQQRVGAPAATTAAGAAWKGDEIAAFRVHVPSPIAWHNAGAGNPKRGNILVWEQPLRDRLQGQPIALEARMESESILHRTLYLFAATFAAVIVAFAVVIWWIMRKGQAPAGV